MANLVIPRREIWTKQPPVATELDWSNPLTAGLISAVLPSAKLFAGTSPSSGGFTATNHLVTEHGIALGRNGGAWSLTQRPIGGITTTSDMTLLSVMYGDSTVLTESNPVTTGQSAAGISSSICVGDGTAKSLRYRIYLGVTRYVGGSSVIPERPTVVVGRQRYGIEQALFVGGEKDPITGSYTGAISGATHFGCYNGNASTRVLLSAVWSRALSDEEIRSISENPWQIFSPRETRLFVTASSGAVNGIASGSFSPVSVTPQTAGASGSASASGSLASISITPATATASAGGSATASGAFATISLSAPTATATGTAAGGANATGTPAQITISHATAIAIGSAVASGGYQSIGITAPTGTASVGNGNATATGEWASVSITAPAAYASSGFIRAPAGIGPTVIQPGSIRPRQSATSRPSNTSGRRY